MKSLSIILTAFLFLPLDLAFAENSDTFELHHAAWENILKSEKEINKYALYASRLLSVKHPEVYLQADMSTLNDIRQRWPDIAKQLTWKNLEKIRTIHEKDRYPEGAPFFPLLDRRLLPATATLRILKGGKIRRQTKMTALEKSVLAYFIQTKIQSSSQPHILYCRDSRAYLVSTDEVVADEATAMSDMKKTKLSETKCEPLLIFSKETSWFPLMGREAVPPPFKKTLSLLRREDFPLVMTREEKEHLPRLQQLTVLNPREKSLVFLLVQKRGPMVVTRVKVDLNYSLLSRWQENLGNYPEKLETNVGRIHTGLSHLLMQEVHLVSNRLSPMTAYLASNRTCRTRPPECLIHKYQKYFAWNLLWAWGFTSLSLDEALASGGGGVCAEQATYTASILELMDIDYYAVHFLGFNKTGKRKDHRIVYVPSWDATFSGNKLFKGFLEPNNYKNLIYISNRGGWTFFTGKLWMGNASRTTSQNIIKEFLAITRKLKPSYSFFCGAGDGKEEEPNHCDFFVNKLEKSEYYQRRLH